MNLTTVLSFRRPKHQQWNVRLLPPTRVTNHSRFQKAFKTFSEAVPLLRMLSAAMAMKTATQTQPMPSARSTIQAVWIANRHAMSRYAMGRPRKSPQLRLRLFRLQPKWARPIKLSRLQDLSVWRVSHSVYFFSFLSDKKDTKNKGWVQKASQLYPPDRRPISLVQMTILFIHSFSAGRQQFADLTVERNKWSITLFTISKK